MNWKRFGYQCLAVLYPNCWIRFGNIDRSWDNKLWEAIEQGLVSHVGDYSAIIDGQLVWIENYPYASGALEFKAYAEAYCSRATALYLQRSLDEARIMDRLRGLDRHKIMDAQLSIIDQNRSKSVL